MEERNEIIDVEVEEEIVEEYTEEESVEEITEKEPEYSDEEIDVMCNKLKDILRANSLSYSKEAEEIAFIIASNSKEYLDNNTYLWVMYTYGLKYAKEENPNAERFIHIRMRSVIDAMENKRPAQQALTFVPCDLDNSIITLVKQRTEFMDKETSALRKHFYSVDGVLVIVFAWLLKFVFDYEWLTTIGLSALVFFMNYKFTYKSMVKKFFAEQTQASKDYCEDKEIIIFDLPVFNS